MLNIRVSRDLVPASSPLCTVALFLVAKLAAFGRRILQKERSRVKRPQSLLQHTSAQRRQTRRATFDTDYTFRQPTDSQDIAKEGYPCSLVVAILLTTTSHFGNDLLKSESQEPGHCFAAR